MRKGSARKSNQALRRRQAEIHKAMDDYYASLSDREVAEDRAWGQFALEEASEAEDW